MEISQHASLFNRVWRNKWVVRLRRTTIVVVLVVGAFCGYMYSRYPGFVTDVGIQYRQTPFSEFLDQYRFFMYFGEYYGKLRENPATGMYDFEDALKNDGGSHLDRGTLAYHAGHFSSAVELIEEHIAIHGESEDSLYWLALAYQRVAEQGNCALHCRNGTSEHYCSLPLVKLHQHPAASRKAVELLTKLLDDYDANNKVYLWLLNFSYMTLGKFPNGVPADYLIGGNFIDIYYGARASAAQKEFASLVFTDRAGEMGINTDDCGRGVAVEDFDGDGYLDIITGGTFSALRYFRNVGGQTYEDATEQAGLGGLKQVHIMTAADYDNDGWMDLIVSRPFHHFVFFRNNGDGTFRDVTLESGLLTERPSKETAVYTCVPTWGDFNNDGNLDLFLAQFGQTLPFMKGLLSRQAMSSRLYMNVASRADGLTRGFRDVTDAMGLRPYVDDKIIISAPFGDYDGDGWTDLLLSNYMGQTALYRNENGKRFSKTNLIKTRRSGFKCAFLDINHDGQLDLFHAAAATAMSSTRGAVFDEGTWKSASAIYIQKNGEFEERLDAFDGGMRIGTMGVAYGDINNDGAYEFYLGTGNADGAFVLPNSFFVGKTENRHPTGMMKNASMINGFGTIQKGHGIVFFDFDHDGDQDIYQSLGGMWPGDAWPNNFFVNESKLDNAWIKIRLRGRQTNRYGVGCWIRVDAKTADGHDVVRHVYMHNNTGFGSAPYLAHIGLMDADRVERVEVLWPVSGTTQNYEVKIDSLNILDENGASEAVQEPHGPIRI